jgi:hypothetical protein
MPRGATASSWSHRLPATTPTRPTAMKRRLACLARAWLFVAGPAPPPAMASVAVVDGGRASPLRRAAARSFGAGLARAG